MTKGFRTLLTAMVILCISTAMIVGGTYALFSDYETVGNHLVAGNLDIALTLVDYREYVPGDDGLLTLNVDQDVQNNPVDLVGNDDTLFTAVNAVPESYYQATIEIKNKGTTAYDYDVRILWNTENDATAEQHILASQIEITITSDKIDNETHTKTFLLSDCADNVVPLGYMLRSTAENESVERFTITAKFVDDENNDRVQNVELSFDIQVNATQKISL